MVSATGSARQDVLIDGERIVGRARTGLTGARLRPGRLGGAGDRRDRQVRDPRRHRRAHPHGDAVRRHLGLGHLRDRHAGRRPGAARPRSSTSSCSRTGQQVMDTLAAWHEKAAGNCAIDYGFHQIIGDVDDESLKAMDALIERGHHQLQAVHGLPGRVPVRRRADPAGHADRGRQRRADHDARGERLGDRRARPAGAGARRDRAVLPRRHPALADRAGGDPPGDHARRPDRRAALRRARLGQAGDGPDRRGARRRAERLRRDLPAVPVPVAGGEPRRARASRAPSGSARRRCARGPRATRTSCGATSAPATSRPSPPTTARSA